MNTNTTYVVHNEEKCMQYTYTHIIVLARLRMKYLHVTFVEMSNKDYLVNICCCISGSTEQLRILLNPPILCAE